MQRFKAVESASADGDWATARHHELIAPAMISSSTQAEREAAISAEMRERKYHALRH